MNLLDIVILLIFGYTIYFGFTKGLMRSLFELIAIVSGICFALAYFSDFSQIISRNLNIPLKYSNLLSFFLIWAGVFLIFFLIGILLHEALAVSHLGWLDYIGGGFIGFLKGCFFVLPFILFFLYLDFAFVNKSYVVNETKPILNYFFQKQFRQDISVLREHSPTDHQELERVLEKNNLDLNAIIKKAY